MKRSFLQRRFWTFQSACDSEKGMAFNSADLTEEELLELNRQIVEKLCFWLPLRSVRQDTHVGSPATVERSPRYREGSGSKGATWVSSQPIFWRRLREHRGSARPPNRAFVYQDCAHKK